MIRQVVGAFTNAMIAETNLRLNLEVYLHFVKTFLQHNEDKLGERA